MLFSLTRTPPLSVNLSALDMRFLKTLSNSLGSVLMYKSFEILDLKFNFNPNSAASSLY